MPKHTYNFPKRLYVYVEWDGDDAILMPCREPREAVDPEKDRDVGIYGLIGIGKAKVTIELGEPVSLADK